MKYLKTYSETLEETSSYNESIEIKERKLELTDDVIANELHDICLELSDEGFDISITKDYYWDVNHITLLTSYRITFKKPNEFIREDIHETLLRMEDYLKSENFRFDEWNNTSKPTKVFSISFIENGAEKSVR